MNDLRKKIEEIMDRRVVTVIKDVRIQNSWFVDEIMKLVNSKDKLKVTIYKTEYMRSSSDRSMVWVAQLVDERAFADSKENIIKFCEENNLLIVNKDIENE